MEISLPRRVRSNSNSWIRKKVPALSIVLRQEWYNLRALICELHCLEAKEPNKRNIETRVYRMNKITSVVMGMLLVLCLMPKAEARLGVLVGPSLNLKELNNVLDELNEEFGTNLRFREEGGLMYSFVPESRTSLNWIKRWDISFCRTETKDTIIHPWIDNQKDEIDIGLGLIVAPIFFTRIYKPPSKGSLSPYLGLGLGGVTTLMNISRKVRIYFKDQDGNTQEVNEESSKSLIIPSLGGQLLAGVEYRRGRRSSILLEARYISSAIEIRDPEAKPRPIEIKINWNEVLYRIGLMIGF